MSKKRTQIEVLESIEQSARECATLLRHLCSHFGVPARDLTAGTETPPPREPLQEKTTASSPPVKTEEKKGGAKPTPEESPEDQQEVVTLKQANDALLKIVTGEGGMDKEPQIRSIIQEYGASTLNSIDPEHYPEIIERAREL